MDWLTKITKNLDPVINIFNKGWEQFKFYLKKFKFFLLFIIVAIIIGITTGFVTYWYKGIYEPQRERALKESISVDFIINELNVNLSNFTLPMTEPDILENEYLFSLTTEEVWEQELVDSLRLSSQDLGLNEIISDSNSLMEKIVLTL